MKPHVIIIVNLCLLGIILVGAATLYLTSRMTTHEPTPEEMLVSEVQLKYPESTNWPAKTILNIARGTCQSLDRGATIQQTINEMAAKYPAGAEADYDLIAYTMATGIKELCPQHKQQAREFSNG